MAWFLQQLCQGAQGGQVVRSLAALQEQYREQVEEGRGRVGVESFLALQTAAVREEVGEAPDSEHLARRHWHSAALGTLQTLATIDTWPSAHLALYRHLALYILGPLQTTSLSTIPHHCPLQVTELSGTSPDGPLLQHRHRVLLHLPQSSTAIHGDVTALAILDSHGGRSGHCRILRPGED